MAKDPYKESLLGASYEKLKQVGGVLKEEWQAAGNAQREAWGKVVSGEATPEEGLEAAMDVMPMGIAATTTGKVISFAAKKAAKELEAAKAARKAAEQADAKTLMERTRALEEIREQMSDQFSFDAGDNIITKYGDKYKVKARIVGDPKNPRPGYRVDNLSSGAKNQVLDQAVLKDAQKMGGPRRVVPQKELLPFKARPMNPDMARALDDGYHAEYFAKNKGFVVHKREINPKDYLDEVDQGFRELTREPSGRPSIEQVDRAKVEKYKKAMLKGDEFPALELDYTKGGFDQEGRHRAVAAMELGVDKVPVAVKLEAFDSPVWFRDQPGQYSWMPRSFLNNKSPAGEIEIFKVDDHWNISIDGVINDAAQTLKEAKAIAERSFKDMDYAAYAKSRGNIRALDRRNTTMYRQKYPLDD